MPSTYTTNNGIELIGTGEQSGTWGDTTNTNLSLIDASLDGQVTITLASAGTSGSPNSLPITDGAASNGRNRLIIFNDGSDLGATAYVQLTPNDAEKIVYIRNDLSGSRSIIVFQGTYNASNDYEIPAGTTAVIYFNGGGAGAVAANVFNNAYFDSLTVGGTVTATSLGVGTSSGSSTFGGANGEYKIIIEGSDSPRQNYIGMSDYDELVLAADEDNLGVSSNIQFRVDASEVMRITNTGSLGIGTTSPDNTLDVTATYDTVANVLSNGSYAAKFSSNTGGDTGRAQGILISGVDANTRGVAILAESKSTSNNHDMVFAVSSLAATPTERMRITDEGSVGIGTASPASIVGGTDTNPVLTIGGADAGLTTGDKAGSISFITTDISYTGTYADGVTGEIASVAQTSVGGGYGLAFYTGVTTGGDRGERVIIDMSGNVGIGTSAPDEKFEVFEGNIKLGTDANTASKLIFERSAADRAEVYVGSSNQLQFDVGGAEAMRIESSGRVGIGGITPSSMLHVEKSETTAYDGTATNGQLTAGSTLFLQQSGGSNAAMSQIVFQPRIGYGFNRIVSSGGSAPYMTFVTDNVERMRLDTSGNVGIGTSSPASIVGGSDSNPILTIAGADNVNVPTGDKVGSLSFKSGDASWTAVYADGVSGEIASVSESSTGAAYGLAFYTGTITGSDRGERVRIDRDGNVGIGTTSPSAVSTRTTVDVSSSAGGAIRLSDDTGNAFIDYTDGTGARISVNAAEPLTLRTNSTDRVTISSSGNVGIGTSSPSELLHLTDTSGAAYIRFDNPSVARNNYIGMASSDNLVIAADEANLGTTSNIQFRVDASEIMRINYDGRVGINTDAPQSQLHVEIGGGRILFGGSTTSAYTTSIDVTDNGMEFWARSIVRGFTFSTGSTQTERVRISSSGNVGIGTASPSAPLDVVGSPGTLAEFRDGAASNFIVETSSNVTTIGNQAGSSQLAFKASNAERMRIDASGRVLIGATTMTVGSSANTNDGTGFAQGAIGHIARSSTSTKLIIQTLGQTANSNQIAFVYGSSTVGSITSTSSATAYNTSSDYRLKEDVQPMAGASGRVLSLNPVNFAWKSDGTRTDGFLAHEAQVVAPYAVTGEKDGEEMQSIDHSKLVPLLTAALQEALGRIETLEAEVAALKA